MVNKKIFLRLGKNENGRFKVDASLLPSPENLWSSANKDTRLALPTVFFSIDVDIPDEKFEIEKVATAKINFKLEENRLLVKTVESI